ncbi:autotransporter outer membrane beta-barrel domain-containing protein (plasmid) [Cetobacterium somerae]|uniref:autotransporter outer membrane beta-barrel domain-containing protein n=1 Tax=Cetobacterium somerae TaxID=188913 RepID=UPI003D769C37
MKKFNLLLLAFALQTSNALAQDQNGLIFWSDYNYFKNSYRPTGQTEQPYFSLSKEFLDPIPVDPPDVHPVIPPVKPPKVPSKDTDKPVTPPKAGYIFYNKVFYVGKTLYTDKLPLKGDLTIDQDKSVAMGSTLKGYTLYNKNVLTINNNPHNTTTTGMQACGGGVVINEGKININGLYGTGINIIRDGEGINNSSINLNSYYATGIQVYGNSVGVNNGIIEGDGYEGAQVTGSGLFTNAPSGIINLNNGSVGICVYGPGKAINKGVVNVNNTNFGMFADSGKVVNNGIINVDCNEDNPNENTATGMGALNSGRVINNGTININTKEITKDPALQGSFAFELSKNSVAVNKEKGVVNLNKNGILLNGPGTLYNWGKIVKPKDNIQPLTSKDGKLVMEKGGSISDVPVKTVYLGKSYIGNGYNFRSEAILDESILKSQGEIKSNLYGYKLRVNGDKAVFSKVKFTLLTDDRLGNYLENIYYDSKDTSKNRLFDIILSSENGGQFENYLNEIFGRRYFSALMYQTRDAIEFGNNNILNHLTETPTILSKERYIFGYSFEKSNRDTVDNILGYNQELNSLFIGKNYPLNSKLSTGWIFNYTHMYDKFKNDFGKREDNLFQGTAYLNYSKNNLNGLGAIYLGYSKGDLDRNINFDYTLYNQKLTSVREKSFNESLNSKIKNYYLGGMGKLSKTFNWNNFYIEPIGKFQSMAIFQKHIDEHNGSYNLDLNKLDGFLNTFYLGGDLGKEFSVKKMGVKLSLVGYLKQDLNNIDKNVKFKVKSLGDEEGVISINNKNRFSQEVGVNLKVGELKTGLSVYTNYLYEFSKSDSWKVTAGISYIL